MEITLSRRPHFYLHLHRPRRAFRLPALPTKLLCPGPARLCWSGNITTTLDMLSPISSRLKSATKPIFTWITLTGWSRRFGGRGPVGGAGCDPDNRPMRLDGHERAFFRGGG